MEANIVIVVVVVILVLGVNGPLVWLVLTARAAQRQMNVCLETDIRAAGSELGSSTPPNYSHVLFSFSSQFVVLLFIIIVALWAKCILCCL